jgi:hypothetical protein
MHGVIKTINREMELAAIWLDSPLQMEIIRSARVMAGDMVKVENGQLIDLPIGEAPTHKVLHCTGTIDSSSLNFILLDINTNKELIIKLK